MSTDAAVITPRWPLRAAPSGHVLERLRAWVLGVPSWAVLELMLPFAILVSIAKHDTGGFSTASVAISTGQGVGFVLGGLLLRRRLPDSQMWAIVAGGGFALLAEDLQFVAGRPVWAIGCVLANASFPFMIWIALAFPTGRLAGRGDGALVALAVAAAVGMCWPAHAVGHDGFFVGMPDSPALDLMAGIGFLLIIAALSVAVARLLHRWARATGAHRWMFLIFATGWLSLLVAPQYTDALRDARARLHSAALPQAEWPTFGHGLLIVVPIFSVVVGTLLLRVPRVDVDERVLALGERVTPLALRDTLADVLRDPALRVLTHEGDAFTDEHGRPAGEPVPGVGQAVTILGPADVPVGAVIHARALLEDQQLHAAVRRAAGQALELRRLRASAAEARRAVYAAADAARARLERDLHDGAQQRLVALAMSLGELRARLEPAGDPEVEAMVGRVTRELREAIADLRRLAAGTFPAGLARAGLLPAVEDLVDRTPLQTRLVGDPGPGLDELTQSTAYFVACEGIANALKHAAADSLTISFTRSPTELRMQVADDGCGGAQANGRGLRGLTERTASLGGTLQVTSPPHGGTVLDLCLPLTPPAPGGNAPQRGVSTSATLST